MKQNILRDKCDLNINETFLEAACKPSPCGANTKCEVVNEVPVCSCLPGYRGSPLTGCRHECESDSECPNHLACSSNFRCENPCQCGENAECHVINHQAMCSCPTVSIVRKISNYFLFNDQCITKIKKDLYLQLEFLSSVTLLFLQNCRTGWEMRS